MLGITLGDPYSTNIECIAKTLLEDSLPIPIVLFGSGFHWETQTHKLNIKVDITPCTSIIPNQKGIYFVDTHPEGSPTCDASQLSTEERGKIAISALEACLERPEIGYVITGPIDKYACQKAGWIYPGHTEYFSEQWGGDGIMVLAGDHLRVGLVTTHIGIDKVSQSISRELLENKIDLFHQTIKKHFHINNPQIAICGLNPHAGDGGLFGQEEIETLSPTIDALKSKYSLFGPFAADTIFHEAIQGKYDGVLAMYHDQGLVAVKTIDFYSAINITGGLKKIRISPDHGPGSALYLKNSAHRGSWKSCIRHIKGMIRSWPTK